MWKSGNISCIRLRGWYRRREGAKNVKICLTIDNWQRVAVVSSSSSCNHFAPFQIQFLQIAIALCYPWIKRKKGIKELEISDSNFSYSLFLMIGGKLSLSLSLATKLQSLEQNPTLKL